MTMRAQGASTTFLPGNVVAKTANYTITAADSMILGDTTAVGAFTVTLPPAASSRAKHVIVQQTGAGGVNAITIQGNGAELINGANTFVQGVAQFVATHLFCDGTKWYIVGHNH